MRRRILGLLICGLMVLIVPTLGKAGTKEDAFAAIEQWSAALNAGDVERIVATYTPDALVLGTVSPVLASSPDELRKYFSPGAAAKVQVKIGEYSAIVISDSAVIFSGFYEFSRVSDGKPIETPARFSFLTVKRDGKWSIAHHHSSVRPKPPQ
jgi:uncharacterized protein (TIGR02246 family)